MDKLQPQDVPYGDDWDSAEEVAAWAERADRIRPCRAQIRDRIARRVAMLPTGVRVGPFDCVLSMQAVHELRHKRYALRLYEQAYQALAIPGHVMICDHTPLDDSSKSAALYMTEREQREALERARFTNVHIELRVDKLVLCSGKRSA